MSKKIVYGLEIDSSQAESSMGLIENRLQALTGEAAVSQREVNGLRQELKELSQTNVDQSRNIQSAQNLKQAYRELIIQIQGLEQGSEEFIRLTARAGELRNQINDVNDSIRNLSGSPFQNLNNSFRGLRTNIVGLNFPGVLRNFNDMKTSLLAMGSSFIGLNANVSLATNGLRLFRAALIATGVGAFLALIATLIANFNDLKESGGALGAVFTGIGNIIDGVQKSFLALSDAIGLTENALDNYNNKKLDEKFAKQLEKENKVIGEATEMAKKYMEELEKINDPDLRKYIESQTESNKVLNKIGEALEILRKKEQEYNNGTIKLRENIENKNLQLQRTRELLANPSDRTETEFRALTTSAARLSRELNELNAELEKTTTDAGIKDIQKQIAELERARKELPKVFREMEAVGAKGFDLAELEEIFKKNKEFILNRVKDNKNTQEQANSALLALEVEYYDDRIKLLQIFYEILDEEGIQAENAFAKNLTDEKIKLVQAELALQKDQNDKIVAEEKRLNAELDRIMAQRPDSTRFDPMAARKEDVENSQRVIAALEKEFEFRKAITNVKLQDRAFDLQVADERLRVLEEYGLKDTEIYQDAVNKRLLAEKAFMDEKERMRQADLDRAEKAYEKERNQRIALSNTVVAQATSASSQIQTLLQQQYSYEMQLAGDNQKEINKIMKKQFEVNKAFSIVDIILSTAQAIMNIWASTPNPIAAGVLTGIVAAIGAAQVAVAASQTFNPNQVSGSNPAMSANAAGSQSMAAMAPSASFAQAGSGMNVQTAGGGAVSQNINVTGSISISEINDVNQAVNIFETGSLIGGG